MERKNINKDLISLVCSATEAIKPWVRDVKRMRTGNGNLRNLKNIHREIEKIDPKILDPDTEVIRF